MGREGCLWRDVNSAGKTVKLERFLNLVRGCLASLKKWFKKIRGPFTGLIHGLLIHAS